MRIIRSNKQVLEITQLKEKINEQKSVCPCCGVKDRIFFSPIVADSRIDWDKNDGSQFHYYECSCKKCGCLWATDGYPL